MAHLTIFHQFRLVSVLVALIATLFVTSSVQAEGWIRDTADRLAPAGIFGGHVNTKGEWLVEYRYANTFLEDNQVGETIVSDAAAIGATSGVTVDGILTNQDAAPVAMTRQWHIANIMFGATDNVTLYSLFPFADLSLENIRGDANPAGRGSLFTLDNSGLGDIQVGALYRLLNTERYDLILNVGGSLPTGDIFHESTTQSGGVAFQPQPYPMRLGSGTFNFRPGITYRKYGKRWSSGAQVQADLPFGRNYRGYSTSDEYRINSWTSVLAKRNWAFSLRTEYLWRTDYDGADPALPNSIASTNVEEFRGGYWVTTALGTQIRMKNHYLSAEIAPVLMQDVDGIQLETDYQFFVNWATSF